MSMRSAFRGPAHQLAVRMRINNMAIIIIMAQATSPATARAPGVCTLVPFINPRRACAARVTVVGLFVCLFVCLFVSIYSRTTGYEAAYERYQQLQCYKGRKNNVAILLKRLRSRDMARPIPSISGAHAHYAYNRTPHIACV